MTSTKKSAKKQNKTLPTTSSNRFDSLQDDIVDNKLSYSSLASVKSNRISDGPRSLTTPPEPTLLSVENTNLQLAKLMSAVQDLTKTVAGQQSRVDQHFQEIDEKMQIQSEEFEENSNLILHQ